MADSPNQIDPEELKSFMFALPFVRELAISMQSAAPAAAATPNAFKSASPDAIITEPISAVATNPPVRATVLLSPDAAPTCRSSTDIKAAVVNGATAPAMPTAITIIAGRTPSQ